MSIRIAINGYGRIGRNVLRAFYELKEKYPLEIVAINDFDVNTSAHLTKYDSTFGRFQGEVSVSGNDLVVNGDKIRVSQERSPEKLPWNDLKIDLVLECSGHFTSKSKAEAHLKAGAKKVLISAPAGSDLPTIVYGVNHSTLKATDTIVSNASCTTNCLAPLVKPLQDSIGIVSGFMNTIHAFTNDQVLADVYHSDLRRARAATESIIPTKTGAASAIGLVIPELVGKLDGFAMRVPVLDVSVVDLTIIADRETSVTEVNDILKKAATHELKSIVMVNEEPLVSIDFKKNPASSIYDLTQTKVISNLVKVLAWYDNEWGFSNRMLDTAVAMMEAK